jgi:hypothetical protein
VSDQRWRVNWGWLPAAIFVTVIGWSRYGWWLIVLIALGVGVGLYGEGTQAPNEGPLTS